MKKIVFLLLISFIFSCKNKNGDNDIIVAKPKIIFEFGYRLNDYKVINDTIKPGENFSTILDKYGIEYVKVLEIVSKIKDTFDVRKIKGGIPYTILAKLDSTQKAQVFIYKHSLVNYTVIDFKDSLVVAYNGKKPMKTIVKTASGIINSSLTQSIIDAGLTTYLAYKMEDIYGWSIDFYRLQKNDRFKLIYEQHYINDTIPVGIGEVKAAFFEHGGKPYYAFTYVIDSTNNKVDYYDDVANALRRQFLKAPVKLSRISSRYNLNRRIAFYGNRVRAHKGTDYAAPVGTPILTTASGIVQESRFGGGNGNYVKVRHSGAYSTQYLHMSKRAVKVGQRVSQGDVIGYIGMTGNTSGPHVCYRFWKNGVQVDPLRERLPNSEPMKESKIPTYFKYIEPIKLKLDAIPFAKKKSIIPS